MPRVPMEEPDCGDGGDGVAENQGGQQWGSEGGGGVAEEFEGAVRFEHAHVGEHSADEQGRRTR